MSVKGNRNHKLKSPDKDRDILHEMDLIKFIIQVLGFTIPLGACFLWPELIVGLFSSWITILLFMIAWALWVLVAHKAFELAFLEWIVPSALLIGRIFVFFIY